MRWVIGAWRGSAAAKAAEISGIEDLQDVMNKKRIRWAASVYARHLPQLREIAQPILEEAFGTHSVEWQWMDEPVPMDQRLEIEEVEWCESKVDGYSDGSRVRGVVAGANSMEAEYLGQYATVMDAEMLGIAISLEAGHTTIA